MAERCIHEMVASTCGDCNGATKRAAVAARPDPAGYGPWFTARRPGTCDGCPDPIVVGDMIRADGEGGWLCWECGEG